MKKLLSLCLVLLCLSASALAAEEDQDGPLRWMFGTDAEYTAALDRKSTRLNSSHMA